MIALKVLIAMGAAAALFWMLRDACREMGAAIAELCAGWDDFWALMARDSYGE